MRPAHILIPTLLTLTAGNCLTAFAADPAWEKGKTDESYQITVYRNASCECCKGWIAHLKHHNFAVEDVVVNDMSPYKKRLGVPAKGASCHTAVVNEKVIEGHVPAQDIKALLRSGSDIRLLTVPGMPSGGPGMDFPGARKDAFNVYAVTSDERIDIFKEYSGY